MIIEHIPLRILLGSGDEVGSDVKMEAAWAAFNIINARGHRPGVTLHIDEYPV